MIANDRQLKIIQLIEECGSVEVEKLASQLDVSHMTIRRDLIKLENDGKVQRCHGGAILMQETTYANKQTSNIKQKQSIAKKCADFVKDGDVIFLDAGTTTFEIANVIKDIPNILVVTPDLKIATFLNDTSVKLIVCGGTVQQNTGYIFGYYAVQMVRDIKFDVGFFGAATIDENFQVITPTEDKIFIKIEAKKQCKKSYMVVDSSKFKKQSALKVNNMAEYTEVITDKKFTKDELIKIKQLNISILNVD